MPTFEACYNDLVATNKAAKQSRRPQKHPTSNSFAKTITFLVGCNLCAVTYRTADRFLYNLLINYRVANSRFFLLANFRKTLIAFLLPFRHLVGKIIKITHKYGFRSQS